jgi:hypothetical protein
MKKLLIILLSLICITNVYAEKVLVTGKVLDYNTLEPIPSVHVFIAGTTFGAITNSEGEFALRLDKYGENVMVVKCIGYYSSTIDLNNLQDNRYLTIKIKPQTYTITETNVVGSDPFRESKFKLFKDRFLGFSKNGRACKILNPNVLRFTGDFNAGNVSKKWHLNVIADSLLLIYNKNLGYEIVYNIAYFNASRDGVAYFGYPLFNDKINAFGNSRKIDRERLHAYEGSKLHFFRALYANRLREEGFEVYKLSSQILKDVKRTTKKMSTITLSEKPDEALFQTDTLLNLSEYLEVKPATNSAVLTIYDAFEVRYIKKREESGYYNYSYLYHGLKRKPGSQISVVRLKTGSTRLFSNGSMEGSDNLITFGYWSYKQLGDQLPYDFTIGTNKQDSD